MSSTLATAAPADALSETLTDALAAERPRLARLCRQLTHNAGAAEDLAQETLLEAWRLAERHRARSRALAGDGARVREHARPHTRGGRRAAPHAR